MLSATRALRISGLLAVVSSLPGQTDGALTTQQIFERASGSVAVVLAGSQTAEGLGGIGTAVVVSGQRRSAHGLACGAECALLTGPLSERRGF